MRRDRLRCGEGGVREEMHAYSLFVSRFVQFCFFWGGGGAIFALAVSIQLNMLFVAISSASALFSSFQGACLEFTLTWASSS